MKTLMKRVLSCFGGKVSFRHCSAVVLGLSLSLLAWADGSSLSGSNATVTVTGPAATTLGFPVTRTGDLGYDAYLDYQTQDGSAVAGRDYTTAGGQLRIPAGAGSAAIPVGIRGSNSNPADKTFALHLLGAAGVGATPAFGAAAGSGAGNLPTAVAVGDFNCDGKPDLAVANSGSNSVSILFNSTAPGASGTSLTLAATLGVGSVPRSVVVADFNGDGRPDLAVVNSGGNGLSILLNTTAPGAAGATFKAVASPGAGSDPYYAAVGDFNGDGKPDLAVASYGDNSVSILLNATAPGAASADFTWAASATVGSHPIAIAVSDFNGDGKPDVAVVNSGDSSLSILLNSNTSGAAGASFTAAGVFGVGSQPRFVAAGDFNGDGKPDLAVANGDTGTVTILFNGTTPGAVAASFAFAASKGAGDNPASLAAGDFNGDGKPDLAVANTGDNTVSILLNTTAPGAASAHFTLTSNPATGSSPYSVAVGDFNGDGKPDLAVANYAGNSVSILRNITASPATGASFSPPAIVGLGSSPYSVAVGDFNGDGKSDLALANYGGDAVSILLNKTAPGAAVASFSLTANIGTGAGSNPSFVAVSDFNGDGRPDLAVAELGSNSVAVLFNTTTPGSAGASFTPAFSRNFGGAPYSLAVGDFNGDGKPDLAVPDFNNGTVSILLNGTATGGGPANAGFALAASPRVGVEPLALAVGDFNGDGKPDLAVANERDNTVSILLNNTPTSASLAGASFSLASSPGVGTYPFAVAVGDFNGDGKPDLAVANDGSDNVSILLNKTAPGASGITYAPAANVDVGHTPLAMAVADFNGDGKPDLAVTNYGGNTVSILFNTTAAGSSSVSFNQTAVSPSYQPGGPRSVAAGDFNGDGRPDLAVANFTGKTAAVLLNTQYSTTAAPANLGGTIHYDVRMPTADLSPVPSNFGSVTQTQISAPQSVILSNHGNAALSISGIGITGTNSVDFRQSNTCGGPLAANASCTIKVSFAPTHSGSLSASLTVTSNAPGGSPVGTSRVPLDGTGVAAVYAISASPNTLNFGNRHVGSTSSLKPVILRNTGNLPIGIGSIVASGNNVSDFSLINSTCTAALQPGDSCGLNYQFSPGAAGSRSAIQTASTSNAGTSAVFTLSGVGTQPQAVLGTPASFGDQRVGTSSNPQIVTLSNPGNEALTLSGIAASGDFTQTSSCGVTLAAGSNCSINLSFKPTTGGARTGTLSVFSSAPVSPVTATLKGNGLQPLVSLTASSLIFPQQRLIQVLGANLTLGSLPKKVTLTNVGNITLNFGAITTTGDFKNSTTCRATLAVNASCTVSVVFKATETGTRTGVTSIVSDAPSSPDLIQLSGSAVSKMH